MPAKPDTAPPPASAILAALRITSRTWYRWVARGCPRGTLDEIQGWMRSNGLSARKRGRRPEAVAAAGKASASKRKKAAAPTPKAREGASDGIGAAPAVTPADLDAEIASWTADPRPPSDPMDEAVASSIDLAVERARKERALASLAELRLAQQRGELLPRADVEAGRIQRCVLFRSGLMGLASRVTPMLIGRDGREIEATLDAEHRRLLSEFSGQAIETIPEDR